MPRGDGTGPAGQGPMTGRGMGYCAGYNAPGFMNCRFGFAGRGFGRRMRRFAAFPMQPQPVTQKEEKQVLQEELRN